MAENSPEFGNYEPVNQEAANKDNLGIKKMSKARKFLTVGAAFVGAFAAEQAASPSAHAQGQSKQRQVASLKSQPEVLTIKNGILIK